ncbi:hypothetical protein [Acidimangrovimonas sediminis]|uniref:hypothetical protein n=1 Tax=Acidimangrovimonas sediminis TaxID=2056283 RepID=UPI000C805E16|nr:hypothetical protein [Acidimangrovimonas sediminis]
MTTARLQRRNAALGGRPAIGLSLMLALAACATPQQQCIDRETRDLQVVSRLIAQLETDLARGYTLKAHRVRDVQWVPCGPFPRPRDRHGRPIGPDMCLAEVGRTVERPAAFDMAAARKELAQLKVKRRELERRAGPAIAACRQAYPDKG